MAIKTFFTAIFITFFVSISFGQEDEIAVPEVDSLKTDLKNEGIQLSDSLVVKKRALNPLAPSKAAFYSAVLPGFGQIYNKRYWKTPIVWGAIGGGVYAYTFNDSQYKKLRTAFKRRKAGFLINDESIPETTTDSKLESLQNSYQEQRDLWLLVTIAFYALNIVDANVDAHLKQFNISDDLSLDMDFQPYLELNPITNDPNYGMAMTIKF